MRKPANRGSVVQNIFRNLLLLAATILTIGLANTVSAQDKRGSNQLKLTQKTYQDPVQAPQKIKFEKGDFSYNIYMKDSWVFFGDEMPKITMSVSNANYKKERFNILCSVKQLPNKPLYNFMQETGVETEDSTLLSFACSSPTPGIYQVEIKAYKDTAKHFEYRYNMAYEPQKIDSESGLGIFPDMTTVSGAMAFTYTDSLASALKKLSGSKGNAPQCKISSLKSNESKIRDVSLVEISGGGKQKIKGFYLVPKKAGNYPTIIRFDYCKENKCPVTPDENPNLIEFIVIDTPKEYYSKILAEKAKDKSTSYNDLCSDAFKIIDFIHSRKATDRDMIFTEGNGKGAVVAISMACMDKRVGGCAVYSPDFSTEMLNSSSFKFPQIVKSMKSPLLMEIQLQDGNCPPLNSFFVYNLSNGKKEYYLYSLKRDFVKAKWQEIENNFFAKYNRSSSARQNY